MQLGEWLALKNMTHTDLARRLGVSVTIVGCYVNRTKQPSPSRMLQIKQITKGKVRLEDWCAEKETKHEHKQENSGVDRS